MKERGEAAWADCTAFPCSLPVDTGGVWLAGIAAALAIALALFLAIGESPVAGAALALVAVVLLASIEWDRLEWKRCPQCSRRIRRSAGVCLHCGYVVP